VHSWQLQKAKAQLSELVRCAMRDGPQGITLRGEPGVVVLSNDEYLRLVKQHPNLSEFLKTSPLAGQDIDLTRDKSLGRDVSF
jgi:antitoxin Phd